MSTTQARKGLERKNFVIVGLTVKGCKASDSGFFEYNWFLKERLV